MPSVKTAMVINSLPPERFFPLRGQLSCLFFEAIMASINSLLAMSLTLPTSCRALPSNQSNNSEGTRSESLPVIASGFR